MCETQMLWTSMNEWQQHICNIPPMQMGGPGRTVKVDESKFMHRIIVAISMMATGFLEWLSRIRTCARWLLCPIALLRPYFPLQLGMFYLETHLNRWLTGLSSSLGTFITSSIIDCTSWIQTTQLCTQNTVEGSWANCKAKFRAMYGTSDKLFESHLQEFLWRRVFQTYLGIYCFGYVTTTLCS